MKQIQKISNVDESTFINVQRFNFDRLVPLSLEMIQIINLPVSMQRERDWKTYSGRAFPGYEDSLKRFVVDKLLKSYTINNVYMKVNVNNELADNEIGIPANIAKKIYIRLMNNEFEECTHILFNINGSFTKKSIKELKHEVNIEGLTKEDIINTYISLYEENTCKLVELYRRGVKEEDCTVILRHPVKAKHCVTMKKVKIISDRGNQYVCYATNAMMKNIEGDMDGDAIFIQFHSNKSPVCKYVDCHHDIKIDRSRRSIVPREKLVDVDEDIGIMPYHTANLLNVENPVMFIQKLAMNILGLELDYKVVQSFISDARISVVLNFVIAYPYVELMSNKNNIDRAKEIIDKYELPENIVTMESDKDVEEITAEEWRKAEVLSNYLEMFIRAYFKSNGPKLSGYVQKLISDMSDNFRIRDGKLIFKDQVILEEGFENVQIMDALMLIDRVQQLVVDLKHEKNPLCNLDKAYMLEKIFKAKKYSDNVYELAQYFVKEYSIGGREIPANIALLDAIICYFITHDKKLLNWSYGIIGNILNNRITETPLTKPIINMSMVRVDMTHKDEE